MATELAERRESLDAKTLEQVVIGGDLSKLTPGQRVSYYNAVCRSLGLNPLTKPFDYLNLNGKLVLYARKDATEQLRSTRKVSVRITGRELVDDVYVVTAQATLPDGRTDESIGAVAIGGLKGEARANAMMKAETKAKRRVTLSICGLGMLDETEIETIPDARRVEVDQETGEIIEGAAEHHSGDEPATEKQIRLLYALATKELGWNADHFISWVRETYGAENPRQLTKAQASEAIDRVGMLVAARKAHEPAPEEAAADEQPF